MTEAPKPKPKPPVAKPRIAFGKKSGKVDTQALLKQIKDRQLGALYGLAVGDAFGQTNRQKKLATPPFPDICVGPQTEMIGSSARNVKRGQVSDATTRAIALSQQLKNETQSYAPAYVAKAYIKWSTHAEQPSAELRQAIDLMKSKLAPEFIGKKVWHSTFRKFMGHDILAQIVPLAVHFFNDRDKRVHAVLSECALTHFDPRCQLSAVYVAALIAYAILATEENVDKTQLLRKAEGDLGFASLELSKSMNEYIIAIQEARQGLSEDLTIARKSDPELYEGEMDLRRYDKRIRPTFRYLMYHFYHASTFSVPIIDICNRGGACDFIAAATGAVMGALLGQAQIPEEWLRLTLQANNESNTTDRWKAYHPRYFEEFVTPNPTDNP